MDKPLYQVENWLSAEDKACFVARTSRLTWVASNAPPASIWTFPGGWMGKHLFEEARYCFVYGQFLASAILGFAFIERTLAAMFFASGRNDLERASAERLVSEALSQGWINEDEAAALDRARRTRNPLVHFRKPMHNEQPDIRAIGADPVSL
jgi:hypothetical protein